MTQTTRTKPVAASKVHVNDNGEIRPCKADKGSCRFSDAFHFDTINEAEKYLEDKYELFPTSMYSKSIQQSIRESEAEIYELSEEQKEALNYFTGHSYEWINSTLYAEDRAKNLERVRRDEEELTKITDRIDEIFEKKVVKDQKKRVLYRGAEDNGTINPLDLNVDDEIHMKGYVSTSMDKQMAEEYANGGLLYEIETNEGLNISSISEYPEEQEVLLNRGGTYKVKKVNFQNDGSVHIKLTKIS